MAVNHPKIRIGKPILLHWPIRTGGQSTPLEGRQLTFYLVSQYGVKYPMRYTSERNVLISYFSGPLQKHKGVYGVELWEDEGLETQNVVDQRIAFELVAHTDEECEGNDPDISVTADVELSASVLQVIGSSGGSYDDTELREMIADLDAGKVDKTVYAQDMQGVAMKTDLPKKVSQLENDSHYLTEHQDISGKAEKMKMVEQTANVVTLEANTYNKWTQPLSGVLIIANENFNTLEEIVIMFVAGEECDLQFAAQSLKWFGGKMPKVEAGKTYVVSIVDNLAVGGAYDVVA